MAAPVTQMWFGNTNKMQLVRIPSQGMQRVRQGYSSSHQLENGGMFVFEPIMSKHLEYKVDFGVQEATGAAGLDIYAQYAEGFYGPGPFYFADPMYYDVNLFSYQWSAPGMTDRSPSLSSTGGTVATAANSVNQPVTSMQTYILDSVANNTFDTSVYNPTIIPIPPGYTLWVGWSGSTASNGVVRMESWVSGATSAAASTNLTALSVTGTTRLNTSVASTAAEFVKIGFARSASGTGANVTVTSMMAQLWPTGVTPTLTGNFIPGEGNNGVMFDGGAVSETYVMVDRQGRTVHYKGLSFGLLEVGTWQ